MRKHRTGQGCASALQNSLYEFSQAVTSHYPSGGGVARSRHEDRPKNIGYAVGQNTGVYDCTVSILDFKPRNGQLAKKGTEVGAERAGQSPALLYGRWTNKNYQLAPQTVSWMVNESARLGDRP